MTTKKQKKQEEQVPFIQWEKSEVGWVGKVGGVRHFNLICDTDNDMYQLQSDASMSDDYWLEDFHITGNYTSENDAKDIAEKITRRIVTNPHNAAASDGVPMPCEVVITWSPFRNSRHFSVSRGFIGGACLFKIEQLREGEDRGVLQLYVKKGITTRNILKGTECWGAWKRIQEGTVLIWVRSKAEELLREMLRVEAEKEVEVIRSQIPIPQIHAVISTTVTEKVGNVSRTVRTDFCEAEKKTEESYRMENEVSTSLGSKECEPMIVRKFMYPGGFPLYVGLICGANLDNLDDVVLKFMEANLSRIESKSIQDKRNVAGELTVLLCKTYGRKSEGVAVLWYVDKMFISSLWGDFMVHAPCKAELYAIVNTLPHI